MKFLKSIHIKMQPNISTPVSKMAWPWKAFISDLVPCQIIPEPQGVTQLLNWQRTKPSSKQIALILCPKCLLLYLLVPIGFCTTEYFTLISADLVSCLTVYLSLIRVTYTLCYINENSPICTFILLVILSWDHLCEPITNVHTIQWLEVVELIH